MTDPISERERPEVACPECGGPCHLTPVRILVPGADQSIDTFQYESIASEQVRTLTAKVAELERDAKRYRWLRTETYLIDEKAFEDLNSSGFTTLDKMIDAALAQARGGAG